MQVEEYNECMNTKVYFEMKIQNFEGMQKH